MRSARQFELLTTVRFGAGTHRRTARGVRLAGIKKALLVTDPMLAKMPMTAQAMDLLASAGLQAKLFSDVRPNPVEANIDAGLRLQGGRPRRRHRVRAAPRSTPAS